MGKIKSSFDFKRGFQVYFDSDEHNHYPTEWLFSEEHSTKDDWHYLAYDCNLYPLPSIHEWKSAAIKETCIKVADKFKDSGKNIYLDGNLLDMTKCELII